MIMADQFWILPPIIIDDVPVPEKIAHYTPDLFPTAIYVASENYVSTLTNPSNSPQLLLLTYDDPNPRHDMKTCPTEFCDNLLVEAEIFYHFRGIILCGAKIPQFQK